MRRWGHDPSLRHNDLVMGNHIRGGHGSYVRVKRAKPTPKRRLIDTPRESLGQLGVLPLEVQIAILRDVDIPTLAALRCANRIATRVVDAVPEYAWIKTHYHEVLQAVVQARATSYTVGQLHSELRRRKCRNCAAGAQHVYLVTGKLMCGRCLGGRPSRPGGEPLDRTYLPLLRGHILKHVASRHRGQLDEMLAAVPSALTLPMEYRYEGQTLSSMKRRLRVFDREAVLDALDMDPCECLENVQDHGRRHQVAVPFEPQPLPPEPKAHRELVEVQPLDPWGFSSH